ncbi:MAG: sugar ABC transporter substrate-binding protein [Candidatus Humimicrobiaceae bacterium]
MKKISLWILTVIICISLVSLYSLSGCRAEEPVEEEPVAEEPVEEEPAEEPVEEEPAEEPGEETVEEEEMEVSLEGMETGYVIPYLEGWFFFWEEAWKMMMDEYGVETSGVLTYWEPETELEGVRDMITKGVDAIVLTSTNPDPAQLACQEANNADIPIAVDSSSVAEGPGEPFLDITFDYYDMGELAGRKIAELELGTNVVHMAGIPGFAPTDDQDNALKDVAEETGAYELVATEYTEYSTEETIKLMRDLIQSGLEFDVVVACAQEAAEGAIEALSQEGLLDEKIVISVNGGPMDVANFEEGNLDYAIGQSPGFLALVTGSITLNYLQGIEPFSKEVRLPFQWLTPENYEEEMIPWEVDETWFPIAEHYAETGELVIE